jgi:hypothetical protein
MPRTVSKSGQWRKRSKHVPCASLDRQKKNLDVWGDGEHEQAMGDVCKSTHCACCWTHIKIPRRMRRQ